MEKKLVYLDTDISLGTPGAEIDDGAALIFLLRSPEVQVIAAGSIFGNVPLADAATNLDRLLIGLNKKDIPVGIGAEKPLVADLSWLEEWRSRYGETMPWQARPADMPAATLIIQMVQSFPGRVSILSIGPMTNLALAARLEPAIIPLVREVIVMGGSFNQDDPSPEFNTRCDPEAAHIVLTAGWNLKILGLDLTRRVHFSRRDFSSLPDGNPAVELLRSQAPGWIDRMEEMGWEQDGCALHDAVAAAYLANDTIFKSEKACVEVELADPRARGVTRFLPAEQGKPLVEVITGLDVQKCRDLIWSRINY